jgi:RNA polymerase sigma-70 factor (ECF subfamily)
MTLTFATTRWSVVLAAGQKGAPGSREALEVLCRTYWYPVYAFIRRSEGDADAAADLTQGFFVRFLEKNHVAHADPARGRFRTFLLASVSHYLTSTREHGRPRFVSLDEGDAEDRYQNELGHDLTPEVLYERRFALALLERGLAAARARYENDGKGEVFEALKGFLDGSDSRPYAELAAQLGWTLEHVKVAVHRLRKRHGGILLAEIAETVADPGDAEDELRHLIAVLRDTR